MLLANQDQALDTIGTSLSTLRSQAHLIGQETDEQVLMLGELDADVDQTQTRLQRAMTRMDQFVARTDAKLGGWCVWILIVVCMLETVYQCMITGIIITAIACIAFVNIHLPTYMNMKIVCIPLFHEQSSSESLCDTAIIQSRSLSTMRFFHCHQAISPDIRAS